MTYKDEHWYDAFGHDEEDDDDYSDLIEDMIAAPNIKILPPAPINQDEDGWAERDCPVCKRHLRKKIHSVAKCPCQQFEWL